MVDVSQSLIFSGISTIISSVSSKFFFDEIEKEQKRIAKAMLILVWLGLLVGLGGEYYFSIVWVYSIPFFFSTLFLSYCFWIIAFKKVKLEEDKSHREFVEGDFKYSTIFDRKK